MKTKMKVMMVNILPRKERRLVNIDGPIQSREPMLVKKIGKRWFKIIDGHHRYYKYLENKKEEVDVLVKW